MSDELPLRFEFVKKYYWVHLI